MKESKHFASILFVVDKSFALCYDTNKMLSDYKTDEKGIQKFQWNPGVKEERPWKR